MIVRSLENKDIKMFVDMCESHAIYEKASFSKIDKEEKFDKLLENTSNWQVFVVEVGRQLIGYCSLVKQFSTWEAGYYMYLDCLFVKEEYRGRKVGALLMDRAKDYVIENDCSELQWQTPECNKGAIRFYDRLGAISKTKERFSWGV